jgi:hypothetical protein
VDFFTGSSLNGPVFGGGVYLWGQRGRFGISYSHNDPDMWFARMRWDRLRDLAVILSPGISSSLRRIWRPKITRIDIDAFYNVPDS